MDPAFFRQLPGRDARNVTNMAVSPAGCFRRKLCQIGAVYSPPTVSGLGWVRLFCFSKRLIFKDI
jgi:hypothetical protein